MEADVRVIGVPMDLGADRRGVDMGPSAIRYAGIAEELEGLGVSCTDGGDVPVPRPEQRDESSGRDGPDAKYLPEIATVCERVAADVSDAVAAGDVPLVLGGDHSIAIGTVGGLSRSDSLGIVWFDAHGDFNTPATSPSGNVHGMPLAAILGQGEFADADWAEATNVSEENVAIVGLRSVDDAERAAIRQSDVTAYTMSDIDERGVTDVVSDAIDVATDGTDGVHVSLDLDWLDPTEAPGVGTPERGGVSYREAHASMELLNRKVTETGALSGLELVEVNPILDEHNETAELAVELAASALGKRIL
ncbi:arginase [Halomicrobium urmianum]|uniref:arginase n=1 Tax=Halomicrobium urmianum TaxID=1586233 RepID=UPI001CDA390B|nr:arginase [Halomicrobium urmianum]